MIITRIPVDSARLQMELLRDEAELLACGDWLHASALYVTTALAWMSPRRRSREIKPLRRKVTQEVESLRSDIEFGLVRFPTRLRCFILRRVAESSAHLQGELFAERKRALLEKIHQFELTCFTWTETLPA